MDYNWPEITTETTMEELQEIHKRIWDFVIDHQTKPRTPYKNNCVACEYDDLVMEEINSFKTFYHPCRYCPIAWGEFGVCTDYESIYRLCLEFMECDRVAAASRLAILIRDLPFRKP